MTPCSCDYCTIRSTGLSTVLDGLCPKDKPCGNDLHATRIKDAAPSVSQEWQLIPLTPSLTSDAALHRSTVTPVFPRRRLLLQNVRTGQFATRTKATEGSNVALTATPSADSAWTIMYIDNKRLERFAILSTTPSPYTLDHWGARHINVSRRSAIAAVY